ncbi:MAG: peptidylprolyl isomerase [Myxococcota bacterium]|nr:peptidylprolyl isomerase [Myxococcota bacterium]
MMKNVGQPLVLFLLGGSLIFAADALLRPAPMNIIVVPNELLQGLRSELERKGERGPQALQTALDAWLEDEMLLREAQRLGLNKGDPILRRRMAQVMRFFIAESAQLREPSETELRAHLKTYAERYQQPKRVSFEHHFFSGKEAERKRELAANALVKGETVQSDAFAHGNHLVGQSETRLAQRFGVKFARQLMGMSVSERWLPIKSSLGLHLLVVQATDAAGPAKWNEITQQLRQDWLRHAKSRAISDGLRKLKTRYQVER